MKDTFDPNNPNLVGVATIRIGLLKPSQDNPTGSIVSDVKFDPELDYKKLTPENMQPHVILTGVATKAIRDFLDSEHGKAEHEQN